MFWVLAICVGPILFGLVPDLPRQIIKEFPSFMSFGKLLIMPMLIWISFRLFFFCRDSFRWNYPNRWKHLLDLHNEFSGLEREMIKSRLEESAAVEVTHEQSPL